MTEAHSMNPPEGWGRDKLSTFIGMTTHNTLVYFRDAQELWERAAEVDAIYAEAAEYLNESGSWFAGLFLLHSHAAYRAAVRMAVSGQLPPAYMVMRGCLENALYGLFMDGDFKLQELWLRRSDDPASRKKVRNEFTAGAVLQHLETKEAALGAYVRGLYDVTIDLGAHPNEMGLATVTSMQETDGKVRVETSYVVGAGPVLRGCMLTVVRVGISALRILELVFKERFEILGLTQRLAAVSQSDSKL